jgi:hypothetical protein
VGYKVNSERAVQFRKWATDVVSEFAIKAYVMDDERLKSGSLLTTQYFEEQLHRVREIRLSERKFYQKMRERNCSLAINFWYRFSASANMGRSRKCSIMSLRGSTRGALRHDGRKIVCNGAFIFGGKTGKLRKFTLTTGRSFV